SVCSCVCVFFFQAEDGIRDFHVTGVQTCALPIFGEGEQDGRPRSMPPSEGLGFFQNRRERRLQRGARGHLRQQPRGHRNVRKIRSEERRVGKECRSRWSPDEEKKRKSVNEYEGRQ